MTQVSKYPISKDIEKRIYEIWFKVISDLQDHSDVQDFFLEFLSPVERIMLAKRLSIAVLLAKGYDYASIMKTLRVSPPTIAQVAESLKYTGKGYKKVVEKLINEEKIKEFLFKVDDILGDNMPPGGQNWSHWRKEREEKKKERKKVF